MKKAVITIDKMECTSCATRISKSLREIKGIKEIKINVPAKEGLVECEDNVKEIDLANAIKKAGYLAKSIKFENGTLN
ncbi:MAG: heavy metal-associated domain-containing protein [Nanoarchaeota archaeon]